ncbi:granulocyte-macrophage colony-stimulating factor receptor subunit alpha isoform X2 [Amblyraja radiata]|uniref:granulocyte-macrophage colony-stimulating factor receptor subunit alpha isoform X2 n=1 Tax=Amblyraja radiata TaxID=386614 RepID=UPI00140287FB|nr:granulocyte-macrophage colony-stimulating factor receptor subunit alpha isoform X2 [Amblyraja radiata]
MILLIAYLAIFFALSNGSSYNSPDHTDNLTDLNPPTNFRIVDMQFGVLTFAWDSNLSEETMTKFKVKYIYTEKYFDAAQWESESRLDDPEFENKFELHRGVSVRIKNVATQGVKFKGSNWTVMEIPPSGDPETLVSNFSCVLYNNTFMNCTWRPGKKVPTGTRYKMYCKQEDVEIKCAHYYTDLDGRQGCHIGENGIDPSEGVLICINGSNNSSPIRPYYTEVIPRKIEKNNPPFNVEISSNLTVTWEKPSGCVINNHCLVYQLQLTELDENNIEILHVKSDTKFILINANSLKRFSVKVRMKMKGCGESKYWSDWSNEAFFEMAGLPDTNF